MNSIWNNNIQAFKNRFSQMAELYRPQIDFITAFFNKNDFSAETINQLFPFWTVTIAKNGEFTASENNVRLHSAYNPKKEAETSLSPLQTENKTGAFFYGFGLGWNITEYALTFPKNSIIAIEPEPAHFFASLSVLDWTPVFKIKNCIIALECPVDQIIPLIETLGFENFNFILNPAFIKHSENYFETIHSLIKRNQQKNQINENTKRKFEKLWNRNAERNLPVAEKYDGVSIYKGAFKNKDFLLIAAGPSLEKILPHLKVLKEKMILVCVDTALKAVLKTGIQPHFIVLTDPQFWAYLHIANLSAPESILIADSISYPAVFRFKCKKIVISYSDFPISGDIGKKYKETFSQKGNLGSGGSVATVAWNFCEYCGAKTIFTGGLDLSFPKNQTHIKGSTFEQAIHTTSSRLNSAEKATCKILFSADISKAQDYNENEILTDSRMKMFAWWFESRIAACPHVKTYTLCPESIKIPGIETADLNKILSNK